MLVVISPVEFFILSIMSNSSTYVAETDGQLLSLPPVMKSCALGAIFHKIKDGDKSLAEEVKSLTGMAVCIDNAFEDAKGKLTKAELPTAADEWVGLQKVRSFVFFAG